MSLSRRSTNHDSVNSSSSATVPTLVTPAATPASASELPEPNSVRHKFAIATFSKLTNCDHCERYLWGFYQQGFACQTCGYIAHPECIAIVPKVGCKPRNMPVVDIARLLATSDPITQRGTPKAATPGLPELRSPQGESSSSGQVEEPISKITIGEAISGGANALESFLLGALNEAGLRTVREEEPDDDPALKKGVPFSSEPHDEFIKEVITSRDEWECEISKIRNQPALNIMTTSMQNMSEFLPRVTFMRIGFDWLVSIFTWERPLYTWAALLFYTCICLRPIWLVLLPFLAAWVNGLVEITSKEIAIEEKDPEINTFIAYKYRSTILGGDVDKARETAVEYTLNARFFQNTLGLYVFIYNFVEDKFIRFKTLAGPFWPVWLTAVGLPPSLYAFYYISPRIPLLITGWGCFMATHPLFIAIGSSLGSRLYAVLDAFFLVSKVALKSKGYDKIFMKSAEELPVEIFENQRWWAVSGWNNSTIATERSPWSDLSGNFPKAAKSEYEPHTGYAWKADSEWELVLDWCDTIPDEEGWVYYNNFWEEATPAPRFDCFTRRRMWRRTLVAIANTPQNRP